MAWAPGSSATCSSRLVHSCSHSGQQPALTARIGRSLSCLLPHKQSNGKGQWQQIPCAHLCSSNNSSRHSRWSTALAAAAPAAPPAAATSTPAAAPAASAATAAASPADPCLDVHGLQSRAVGALVGSMCGNALGAQVEPEKHYRLARLFPDGLHDMSWSFDLGDNPLAPGHVTGDYITMLAVAWSLTRKQQADAFDMLDCMAATYNPYGAARYSPYTELALEGLAAGTNPFLLAKHVEGFMAVSPSRASQSCSHRPGRQLHGTTDFTAVMRAVPIGIAYRDAPADVLRSAVDAAVTFTHPTEQGGEGAVAIAAAVAWLLKADAATAKPEQLLDHLLTVCADSPDMTQKLQLLQRRLPALQDLGQITNWRQFWSSQHWAQLSGTANLLWKQNLAVQGTQAAALALWVAGVSWHHPKQAVMLAASLGGYAATTGALVGALVGALHGAAWVPQQWWELLQDEQQEEEADFDEDEQSEEEAEAAAAAATAAAAAAAEEEEGGSADVADAAEIDSKSILRVGKYSVVVLANELAAIDAQQNPQLFG